MNKKIREELRYIIKEYDWKDRSNIDWTYISYDQRLSEDFIREFKFLLNWGYITKYQYLSEDFIREFKNELDLELIFTLDKITKEFYEELTKPIKINRYEIMDIE